MFPLNWNIPFIRKNGSRTTLGNIIENASSELPPHSAGDAGKLLGVKADGSVEWSDAVNSEIQTLTNELNYHKGTRQKLFRMTANTKLVAKVRKTAVVSWGQMVLRFVGTNNGKYYDSIAYAQFNGDGSDVSSSQIVNLASTDPTVTASVDSDYLIITIGNLTNYVILALEYFDNGMVSTPDHEDWVFSQEA